MASDRARWEVRGPVAFVTLDRPDKLNAIDARMVADLNRAMDAVEADERVRVIVLRGEGRAFSAGFDLYDEAGAEPGDREAIRAEMQRDFDLIMRFWDSPVPTIAQVHGFCLGGALEIALACDLAVAAEGCRFGEPEVKFGSGIVALLLPWVCGPRRASELLLTGNDRLDARTALDYGLVNRVCAPEELGGETVQLALAIARNDAQAVRVTRQAMKAGLDAAGLREALREGLEACITIESTETEESRRFREILNEKGITEAMGWLDARLGAEQLTGS